MKLFILLCLVSCLKLEAPTQTPPIAMVKYKDTVYHCEELAKTECGYSIHCGSLSVHCANDIVVEYLN